MNSFQQLWKSFADKLGITPNAGLTVAGRGSGVISNLEQLPSVWTIEHNIEWLIDNLIAKQSVTLLTAESGSGKTWLAYALAGALARGTAFLGIPVHQCPVIYLDGENPLGVVRRNLTELGISQTDALKVWGGWNVQSPQGPENRLLQHFAKSEQGLIIFDSLVEFHTGDEQSSTETRRFMKHFRTLADLGHPFLSSTTPAKLVHPRSTEGQATSRQRSIQPIC